MPFIPRNSFIKLLPFLTLFFLACEPSEEDLVAEGPGGLVPAERHLHHSDRQRSEGHEGLVDHDLHPVAPVAGDPARHAQPMPAPAHLLEEWAQVVRECEAGYEWNVYEPALDAVITPILYARAGELVPDGLRGCGVGMGEILGAGTLSATFNSELDCDDVELLYCKVEQPLSGSVASNLGGCSWGTPNPSCD